MGWTGMVRRVVRSLLSAILGVAGVVHLVRPSVFLPAMPEYVPWHREVILVTGVLELLAAVGLWVGRLARVTAWGLAAYFVAILPAHFHVALRGIPMFGISEPFWLWARLLFQGVFIVGACWLARERM